MNTFGKFEPAEIQELTPEMVAAAKGGVAISAAIEHPAYRHQTGALPETARESLVKDLD